MTMNLRILEVVPSAVDGSYLRTKILSGSDWGMLLAVEQVQGQWVRRFST